MKYIDLFEKFVIKQSSTPTSVQGTGSRPITSTGSKKVRKEDIIIATDDTIDQIVKDEIKRLGNNADLNHIDVSQVTNMDSLFWWSDQFNGDISKYSIDVPELFKFVKILEAKGMKLDLSKIRTIDDLITQLKEKR